MNYQILNKLTQTHAVSGDTSTIISVLKSFLNEMGIETKQNGYGTLLAGNTADPEKLIAMHIDEVGFQVTKIEDNGKIRILPVGWVFPNRVDHTNVYIYANGKQVPGIILHEEELKCENIADFHSLFVDLGLNSKEEVSKLGIKPGVTGSFAKFMNETEEAIIGASIDNKISVFAIFEILKNNPEYLKNNLFAFVTDEEMQDHSANGLCHSFSPEMAVVLDYCPMHQKAGNGDVLGDTGKGAFVMYRGGSYILHEKLRNYFDEKIKTKFQSVFLSSNTVPVLEPSNFEENGTTKAVNVCIPARGYHGEAYIVRKQDIKDFVDLIKNILDTAL